MPKLKARSKASAQDGGTEDQADVPNDTADPPSSILDHAPDTTINPYELMGITRDATEADIKRAYKKGALRWHPDKHPADQKHKAQKAFQQLTTAYAVLSDPVRRRHYDATGKIHDALHMDPNDPWSWQPFYQRCWAEMAEGDIEAFAKEYRFSEEEKQDLLMQYTTQKGNMTKVYEHVTLSNPLGDDDRYRKWINEAIKKGEVESYTAFTKESARSIKARKDKAKKEAAEAEEMKQILKQKGSWFDPPSDNENQDLLAVAIREKNKSKSAAFLDHLMAKYGNESKKKKTPKKDFSLLDEPSEEAFARNRKQGFEEALKRDKERQKAKAPTRPKKRKADDSDGQASDSDGEYPVKKWNEQRKKVKQQKQEDAAARAADPSTDEEGGRAQEDLDEVMYGEPKENPQLRATTTSKPKATSTKKTTTKKPSARNTKTKAAATSKAKSKRPRRAIVESDEEEADKIELGSQDSDEDDKYEG